MVRTIALAALLTAGSALVAQAGDDFFYSSVPRWSSEPEGEAYCAAMRRECAAMVPRSGNFMREVAFDELYDGTGRLRGVRMTRSSGCRPADEEFVLSTRRFVTDMHRAGQPDLADYRVETPAGTSAEGIRIVHHSQTTLGLGCARP